MERIKRKLEELNIKNLNDIFRLTKKVLKILYFLLIVLAIYVVSLVTKQWQIIEILKSIIKILSPVFIGLLIAWLLNPLIKRLINKDVNKATAVILVYFLVILFLYFFSLLIIPSMADQINDLVSAIPRVLKSSKEFISDIFVKIQNSSSMNLDSVKDNFFDKITLIASDVTTNLPLTFVNFVKSLVSGIGSILFGLIIAFYISFDYDKLSEKFITFLPIKNKKEAHELIKEITDSLHSYVKGTLLISFILFIICAILFKIVGLKAPLMFGIFCGITNLIPYIGPYIGGAPAVLVGLTQSPLIGILTLVSIVIIQTIEGCFLQPIIMSKQMNLSPITIIVMLLIFGYLFGIIGMILATPIAALIKIIYVYIMKKKKLLKNSNKEKSIT